jgi:O-antigen/teichoic acid export membrane protein
MTAQLAATSLPAAPSRRLARNVAVLAGSQLITWTMSLAWTLIVPRKLGPAGMGYLVTAWAATGIVGVLLGLGTRNFLVKEMATDPSRSPGLLGTASIVRAALSIPAVLIIVGYVRLAHFTNQEAIVLYLAIAATILTLLSEPFQAVFQAIERMEYLAIGDVVNKSVQALGGIALVLLGLGVIAISVWWVAVAVLVLGLNAWWVRRYSGIDLRFRLSRVRSLIVDSLAFWMFGLFYMVYLWIDSVMLAVMAPPDVVGWYGVPTKLFTTLMFVPVILSTAWLPRLVATFRESPQQLPAAARIPLELVLVLSFPVAVGTALLAGPAIRFLYGAPFAPSIPVLAILALTCIPMYLNIMVNQVLIASNRQKLWTWVLAGATVVNPALNFVLIRLFQERAHNGAIGAAISLLLTELLIAGIGLAVVAGVLNAASVWRLARAALATAGMGSAIVLAGRFGLAASIVAGAVAFAALAVALRVVSADEVDQLRGFGDRLQSRLRGAA